MMTLLFWSIILVVSLAILIKSSDYFTESAEKIGIFFGMPSFIVGVTIVSVGTSLPELISSIIAVLNNASEIVVGNVLGSNITNILLIIGITAVVGKKMKIGYELINVDLPLLIGSAFLLGITIFDGVFTLIEGILFIAGMIMYVAYTLNYTKEKKNKKIEAELERKGKVGWKAPLVLIVSSLFIFLGAEYVIKSIIHLSDILNMGKEIIAVSAIALGTSLPELAVSLSAVRKGKPEIAVGNVLGSNIFNTFAVMGIPALIGTLAIPSSMISFSLPMMLISTLLYFFIIQDKEITRCEGGLLIMFYILFIGKLFNLF